MKKRISAILVLALCVSLCGCGKSRQVQSVEEAISSLGKISLLSFEAIEEAEKMYDALSDEEKESVENISDLRDAREKYDFLAFTASNRPFSYEWIIPQTVTSMFSSVPEKGHMTMFPAPTRGAKMRITWRLSFRKMAWRKMLLCGWSSGDEQNLLPTRKDIPM